MKKKKKKMLSVLLHPANDSQYVAEFLEAQRQGDIALSEKILEFAKYDNKIWAVYAIQRMRKEKK